MIDDGPNEIAYYDEKGFQSFLLLSLKAGCLLCVGLRVFRSRTYSAVAVDAALAFPAFGTLAHVHDRQDT